MTLLPLDAELRKHDLREVFDALRWLVRAGAPWRMLPNDLALLHGLPADQSRSAQGRHPEPSAAIFDRRPLQSTLESGRRADYDGYKRKKGSELHVAVDTIGHLLAL